MNDGSCRYRSAPDFRRLALLDGISIILRSHGPQYLHDSIEACLPMLLHGVDSVETGIMRLATDNVLVRRTAGESRRGRMICTTDAV